MKKILSSVLALSLVASAGAASAQSRGHDNRDRGPQARHEQSWSGHQSRNDNRHERRAERRYNAGRYQAPRGYQARSWHRGERLPASYRNRAYVVNHSRYGLGAPPRGYEYVRVGNDAVLTAVATGVIASVIFSLFN